MRIIEICQEIESQLQRTQHRFNVWMRCNFLFDAFCSSAIDVLEKRRRTSNIASITGSSVGLIGGSLAAIGAFAIPLTMGASLPLVITGGVISGCGSLASVIAKLTELGLNKQQDNLYERFRSNMKEHCRSLEKEMEKLVIVLTKLNEFTESQISIEKKMKTGDSVQSSAVYLRSLSGFATLPIAILRALSRAVVAAEAVFIPLSLILDGIILITSSKNFHQGNMTNKSKELRKLRNFLKLTKIQIEIWGYGNEKFPANCIENKTF
jgi:hypothetical protein